MKTGIELIAEERQRQIEQEGWTPEHDDQHDSREMAWAAMCYAQHYCERAWLIEEGDSKAYRDAQPPYHWYWDSSWWKPKGAIHDLVRAGALIAAEIDRLQRKEEAKP